MIIAFLIPPSLAAAAIAWAYTRRNDDRLSDMPAPRHLAG